MGSINQCPPNTGLWEEVALWVQEQNHIILYKLRLIIVREAFQSKKQQNLGISRKNQKSPKFQLGIVQN